MRLSVFPSFEPCDGDYDDKDNDGDGDDADDYK